MWWSLVVRASMRWVIVGVWCMWVVMVGDGFSIWGSCASGGVVYFIVCWGWLVGGSVDVVVRPVCGHMSLCGVCPCRYSLGVRLRGGLLVRVRCVSVALKRELGGDLLFLLGSYVFPWGYLCFAVLPVTCCPRLFRCQVWGCLGVCVWYCVFFVVGGLGILLCA